VTPAQAQVAFGTQVCCRPGVACNTILVAAAMLAMPATADSQQSEPLRNGFDDPYFQVSGALADCPVPRGPLMTEAERRLQSHHRAERGTTCWLQGQCERPNAYAYDADIAAGVRAALAKSTLLRDSTVWVTVQGRVVYFEGCAGDPAAAAGLEALARQVPDVLAAVATLAVGTARPPPYRVLEP
jgi:hypothetical protein